MNIPISQLLPLCSLYITRDIVTGFAAVFLPSPCMVFAYIRYNDTGMELSFPVDFRLKDGTHVIIHKKEENNYDFFLTRLNSERHNFMWIDGRIEESYETRFNEWQNEAIARFQQMLNE